MMICFILVFSFPSLCTAFRLEVLNSSRAQEGTYCGEGEGTAFDDFEFYNTSGLPTKIGLRVGNVIDSIQLWYGDVEAPRHGGDGGTYVEHGLGEREFITGIKMRQGEDDDRDPYYVCQITFYLSNLDTGYVDTWGPFGECGRDNEGCGEYLTLSAMKYITGRSGNLLDHLVAVF